MNRTLQLLAGFGLLGIILLVLIRINPNHFTSIDSGYYLQSAANLLAGRGYVMLEDGKLIWNGTFPIGYSALIAVVSRLAGWPVLWASKLVNYGAVSLFGYLWARRLGTSKAIWVLSIWWLGGFLKILAYTWSETLFLVLLSEWVWHLNRFLLNPTMRRIISLFSIGYALFLTRYIGGFVFGITGLLTVLNRFIHTDNQVESATKTPPISARLLISSMLGIGGMCFYFWINRQHSDSLFGGARFMPTESIATLALLFSHSLLNECLLIRDFIPGESNGLAWFGLASQLLLIWALSWQLRHNELSKSMIPAVTPLSRLFLLTGIVYVLTLFGLRTGSPFSGPNYRLMAPFTFCLLTTVLLWISEFPIYWQRFLRMFWIVLILLSWLQLLPQVNFSRKIEQIWTNLSMNYVIPRTKNCIQYYIR